MSKIKVYPEELTYGVLGPVAREETVAVGEASSEANARLTAMHPSSLAAYKEAGASSDSPRRGGWWCWEKRLQQNNKMLSL